MGVTSLWKLVESDIKPSQLKDLENNKLAIDASIWLHQFLKVNQTYSDGENETAHIIGFFRRICKLLHYGILPIFVFDGAPPELKRLTIEQRRISRHKNEYNAKVIAEKLLVSKLKAHLVDNLESSPENSAKSKTSPSSKNISRSLSSSAKRKRDEYELPKLSAKDSSGFISKASANSDPKSDIRLPTKEEVEIADTWGKMISERKTISGYDPGTFLFEPEADSIENRDDIEFLYSGSRHRLPDDLVESISNLFDVDSKEFSEMPIETQYAIIKALKDHSRQTSFKRLKKMVENSKTALDFSQMQIQELVTRNKLMQNYMEISGASHRIMSLEKNSNVLVNSVASQRGIEYMLYRSDTPGGGYKLSAPTKFVNDVSSEEITPVKMKVESCAIDSSDEDKQVEDTPNSQHFSPEELYQHIYAPKFNITPTKSSKNIILKPKKQTLLSESSDDCFEDVPIPYFTPNKMSTILESLKSNPKPGVKTNAIKAEDSELSFNILDSDEDENPPENYEYNPRNSLDNIESPQDVFLDYISSGTVSIENSQNIFNLDEHGPNKSDIPLPLNSGINDIKALISPTLEDNIFEPSPKVAFGKKLSLKLKNKINYDSSFEQSQIYDSIDEELTLKTTVESQDILYPSLTQSQLSSETSNQNTFQTSGALSDDISNKKNIDFDKKLDLSVNTNQPGVKKPNSRIIKADQLLEPKGKNEDFTDTPSKSEESISTPEKVNSSIIVSLAEIADSNTLPSADSVASSHKQNPSPFPQNLRIADISKLYGLKNSALNLDKESLSKEIRLEEQELRKAIRNATSITDSHLEDIRTLLRIFGIPYITAPSEAEATCAYLEQLKIVDGVITDDSDVLLFGARSVYRNFFKQDKTVLKYEKNKTSRIDLIFFSYFLGSDYTIGVGGVGPTTVSVIHQYFGSVEALLKTSQHTGIKPPDFSELLDDLNSGLAEEHANKNEYFSQESPESKFKKDTEIKILMLLLEYFSNFIAMARSHSYKLVNHPPKNLLKLAKMCFRITFPPGFPDINVARGYLFPSVYSIDLKSSDLNKGVSSRYGNNSLQKKGQEYFNWNVPDLDLIQTFICEKTSWDESKVSATVIPIIKKIIASRTKTKEKDQGGSRQTLLSETLINKYSKKGNTNPAKKSQNPAIPSWFL
ncbi:hypothetical protein BB560_005577 [Smittium megazygosporum]|uniref:XPG N-terminal domain-containing protein n=1 Tax=Smittium megazygosporum TaxID=133381 RepID=A0A2T9Z338_9FUNG|nr:hypothetical protein BB560_005577 [Smittium megazygosporum]